MRTTGEATAAPVGIPLDLAPLVSPFREHGQILLRVERLARQARLSTGRNNGDGTWSLTLDDLDGLVYVPQDGMDEAHTLSVRVLSLDGGFAITLAQLDVPVPARKAPPKSAPGAAAKPGAADRTAGKSAQIQAALEQKLADLSRQLKKALDDSAAAEVSHARKIVELQDRHSLALQAQAAEAEVRLTQELERRLSEAQARWESELAKTRQQIERARAKGSKQMIEAELAAARTAWEAEMEERLAGAAAEAAANLEKSRAAWREEEKDRLAKSEKRTQDLVKQAQERLRQEAEAARTKAEEAWKADEAARLAAAEAKWRKQSARALAEATARSERAEAALAEAHAQAKAARDRGDDGELRRAREELAEVKALLAARESELAEARQQVERALAKGSRRTIEAELAAARTAWEAELDERLAEAAAEAAANLEKSRAAWRAQEKDRLATAEAKWREQSAQALAEATARFERAEAALAEARDQAESVRDRGDDVELRRLREELAEVKVSLGARESELAKMRQQGERARAKGSRQTIEAELAAARTAWEAELEDRLADAAAEAATKLEASRAAWRAQEKDRLAKSEKRTQDRVKQAQEHWQQEAEAALAKTEEAWKSEEAARLAAAEEEWREQSAKALAEATARFEKAEAALAKARAQPEAARDEGNDVELRRLRDELTVMQAALADRELELSRAQSETEQAREHWTTEAERLLAARVHWRRDGRTPRPRRPVTKAFKSQHRAEVARRIVRGGALAASLAAAVMLYPRVEPMVAERWWPTIAERWSLMVATLGPELDQSLRTAGGPPQPQSPDPTQAAEQRAVIDASVANVRAAPSTASAVVVTLPHDAEVTTVERRGNWVRIRVGGEDGKEPQEGWVYASLLKEAAGR
jgi:hypothetical protein